MKALLILLVLVVLAAIAIAVPTIGGGGPGKGAEGVQQRVTRDFGRENMGESRVGTAPEGETAMRFLQREFEVETRYGGGFVQSIEGYAGGRRDGRPVDWFYYVNGIEAGGGAAARALAAGDRVWWDLHDWGAVMRVPAVVGSFPEPFLSGVEGKRLPVRMDCAAGSERLCEEVTTRLEGAGITAVARSSLQGPGGEEVLRLVVGPWSAVRIDPSIRQLEAEPRASGVFARFRQGGRRLEIFDERGKAVRSLQAGAGLVAATRYEGELPTWVVTGTDAVGAAAAAGAMEEEILDERFAVAVEDGKPVGLPVGPEPEQP